MKKIYFLSFTLLASVGFIAMQRAEMGGIQNYLAKNGHKFSAGSPIAKTGAPGEGNCTDCHSGSTQDGTSINQLLLTEGITPASNYTPGVTYNVTVTLNTQDVMEGFQSTVLDISTNSMAGSFPGTGGLGTAITNDAGTGRDYANHTSSSNTSGNSFWTWTWDAPATDVGPVRFYVATNIANGNGANTGDVIYLSEHVIGSTAGIEEVSLDASNFNAGYSASENEIAVSFDSYEIGKMHLNLVDLTGKSVYQVELGESTIGTNEFSIELPELESGIYVVNFFVGNRPMSKKIMI